MSLSLSTKTKNTQCSVLMRACLLAGILSLGQTANGQQLTGTENGEWRYLGGDAGNTRYSALNQINATNFAELEQAWIWRSDNFGPNLDYFSRATPIYVNETLYTVATPRRQVVAIDPALARICGPLESQKPSGISVRLGRLMAKVSPTLKSMDAVSSTSQRPDSFYGHWTRRQDSP